MEPGSFCGYSDRANSPTSEQLQFDCPHMQEFYVFFKASGRALLRGVPRNFVGGGGSTNSVEDRENGDLGDGRP